MSRLEKARDEKNKNKKRATVILIIALALILTAGLMVFSVSDRFTRAFGQTEANLIDMEKSRAFIDIFGLTYVRIYVEEGKTVSGVTADDEPLAYNSEDDRWELMLSGFGPGDELTITAVSGGDDNDETVQEEVLTIDEL